MAAAKKQGSVLKTGDVVVLKSGGPKMSVFEIKEYAGEVTVWCTWFAGKKNEKGHFRPENLIHAPETDGVDEE